MKIELEITTEQITDLMTRACEGSGATYWCSAIKPARSSLAWARARRSKTPWYARHAFYERDFRIEVTVQQHLSDDPDNTPEVHTISPKSMKRGIELMAAKYGAHFGDWMIDNADQGTADIFLQLCAMGEERYA